MTRNRSLSATLCALLLLAPAGGVVAQTPPPIERTPEMEEQAAELMALFPATLGGVALFDDLEVDVGQELIAELDPSDPDDADDIALIDELMTAAGATLDDAATAVSFVELDEGVYGFVAAYQIRGSDAQQTLPLFVAAFEEDIPDALVEPGLVGDVEVTLIRSGEEPEADALVVLARGDVTWLIGVPAQFLEEAVASLPES